MRDDETNCAGCGENFKVHLTEECVECGVDFCEPCFRKHVCHDLEPEAVTNCYGGEHMAMTKDEEILCLKHRLKLREGDLRQSAEANAFFIKQHETVQERVAVLESQAREAFGTDTQFVETQAKLRGNGSIEHRYKLFMDWLENPERSQSELVAGVVSAGALLNSMYK